jgi:hypothetical protein
MALAVLFSAGASSRRAFLPKLDKAENRRDGCRTGIARGESGQSTCRVEEAEQLVTDLKKRRDEFQATAKKTG